MFVGGFGTCVAQALSRRDARSALAFGFAFLLCAERAGISASLVAWGLIGWTACAALFLLVLLGRALQSPLFATLGVLIAAVLLTGPASAGKRMPVVSLDTPPAPAIAAEAMLGTLLRP